ncbi:hypothetical protein [Sphingobacterium composti Ten et al. 2007 non Yoo et al. 2007]|uniref:hypothetical protein n=1 Tax=Sphingobacterium composti TaxID=363260 RepID=UPI0013578FE4|nr:hypothetical protein [Sphingobacterium composti Ten et al. 2007 non Yoo et al. 2007]
MMFVFGAICLAWDAISYREIKFSKELLIASIIAIIFSIVGLISLDYNNTEDYAYAIYIGSMWMWLIACYGACCCIRITHGYISVKLIANYLIAVCLGQCIIALMIDFIPSVKSFVDAIFVTGDRSFMEKVRRLYGIGASLDVAGIRFASTLVITAVLLSEEKEIRTNNKLLIYYIISFILISVMGNMMARTTTVGLGLGLIYIFLRSGIISFTIKMINIHFWRVLLLSLIVLVSIAVYMYQVNREFYGLIRFAFEGFFNWVETGTWETNSTEVLKNMWVFPDNEKTWIIGDGYFNNPITRSFYMGTDVGYLRFIFYCGLIGLSVFILFFIYLSGALSVRFYYIRYLFLLLLVIVFANWVKVATDIFLVYAFFLVISQPYFENYYEEDFEKI